MKHKVYQGEYTLSHWFDLLVSQNIELPEYQRLFVWNKKKVTEFMKSLKNDQFVPPVTIGLFNINGRKVNYILDGQQRLTSILLTMLELFPKRGKEAEKAVRLMNENDDDLDDEIELEDVLQWTFKKLTCLGKTYEVIMNKVENELYDKFDIGFSTSDYHKHFLSFCYIVPCTDDAKEQQRFYSSVFRNINIRGQRLNEIESRESLYFLDQSLTPFFKAKIGDYCVNTPSGKTPIDFVRYVALLSQYKKENKADKVAAGYGTRARIEDYYEEYIYDTVGERKSGLFQDFNSIFPNRDYAERLNKLNEILPMLSLPKEYCSIIEIDTYFFGLIYVRVVENKNVDTSKKDEIEVKIKNAITTFKHSERHEKSPASLKYLRQRIEKSIEIYKQYEIEDNA